ncbi:MAG: prolipoprotein diacylglyceryl transferase [Magnetococcales bacterium]|nr:prolipoprotein diacylglyceryl transferase [Magnetococcales bacterium]
MIAYPQIDPVLVQIGPLAIRWYGLMYTLAFLLGWPLLSKRAARYQPQLTENDLADLMTALLLGVVVGGRLGYTLFYQPALYLANPLAIFKVWEGGMSFHGGLLGVALAVVWFSRRHAISFLAVIDLVTPVVPLGLFLGRIGNFINSELWGRATDVPWAMIFPNGGPLPRHPSQLYEAFLEGVVLFILLQWLGRKPHRDGFLSGVFLLGYGLSRFMVEFVREPDAHLGLLQLGWSMGQWLSMPMVVVGAFMVWIFRKNP